jgi:hypothetical protein
VEAQVLGDAVAAAARSSSASPPTRARSFAVCRRRERRASQPTRSAQLYYLAAVSRERRPADQPESGIEAA